jgi:hypothetical protein
VLTSRPRKGAPSTSYLLRAGAVVGADRRAVKLGTSDRAGLTDRTVGRRSPTSGTVVVLCGGLT